MDDHDYARQTRDLRKLVERLDVLERATGAKAVGLYEAVEEFVLAIRLDRPCDLKTWAERFSRLLGDV